MAMARCPGLSPEVTSMALTEPLWKSAEVNAVPARTVRRTTRPASCAGSRKVSIASAVGRSIVVRTSGVRVEPSATSCSAVTTETVWGAAFPLGPDREPNIRTPPKATTASRTPSRSIRRFERFKSGLHIAVTGEATV